MHWLQQLTNGLALGSIYALIALGYTMVYGVLRFINFAHSDVLMLGAYAAYFLAPIIGGSTGSDPAVVLAAYSKWYPVLAFLLGAWTFRSIRGERGIGIAVFGGVLVTGFVGIVCSMGVPLVLGYFFGNESLTVIAAIIVCSLAAAICAVIGILIELLAYRPLRNRPKLTVLITAIGVSLFIEFTCQHGKVFGADTKSFPKLLPTRELHFAGIEMASNDLLVLVLTAVLLVALWFLVQHTKMGMALRAVSFNQQAAALMGVNVNRVISFTFGLGSALAAIAGIFYAMRAPGIEPLMGVQPGIRAFIAAVLGGIGNLPGAALGGLLLGVLETVAGGIPGVSNYRDGIAFAILILILIFRPAGLLGRATIEKV